MAPEQLQGAEADSRTDVFGFGCVLYEMITGRRAFGGDTPASVIAAVLEHEPAPLPANSDQITPPALDAIIRTCLAKNPEDRWSSGHDVWLALRRLTPAGEPPTAVAPSTRRSRRAAIPWVIAGLSLAIVIAALYRPFSRRAYGLGSTCHAVVYRLSQHVAGESDTLARRALPVAIQLVWGWSRGTPILSAGSQTERRHGLRALSTPYR